MLLSKYKQQIWKCGRCGYCGGGYPEDRCPSRFLSRFESSTARGKLLVARSIMGGDLKYSAALANRLYECSLCGSCEIICDVICHLDLTEVLEAFRADLVEAGIGPMPRHREILDWIKKEHNPYMEKHEDRMKWIPERREISKRSKIIYFTGCTAPYRQPELSRSFLEVIDAAQVNVLVSPQEWCCGSISLRIGARDLGLDLAKHNVELFRSLGVETVVTHCAGCYRALKLDYPKLFGELPFKILHASEFVEELLRKGELRLNSQIDSKVTYHDPCHLGRHANVFESPRRILESIPGLKVVEMERVRQDSWCCGAGGGMKSAFSDSALKVAYERVKEAKETEAQYLVSACPFCKQNLRDASDSSVEHLKIYDLIELVAMAL